jgi:lambda repressor-like predicted transcriptional regulator
MDPQPTHPSPFRSQVDELLERLVRGLLEALSPLERTAITLQLRRRGWDLRALSQRGPLSGLSDAALAQLLSLLSEAIDGILVDEAIDTVPTDVSPVQAFEQLRAGLAAGGR